MMGVITDGYGVMFSQQLINNPLFTLGYAGLSRFMHTLFYFLQAVMALSYAGMESRRVFFA